MKKKLTIRREIVRDLVQEERKGQMNKNTKERTENK